MNQDFKMNMNQVGGDGQDFMSAGKPPISSISLLSRSIHMAQPWPCPDCLLPVHYLSHANSVDGVDLPYLKAPFGVDRARRSILADNSCVSDRNRLPEA